MNEWKLSSKEEDSGFAEPENVEQDSGAMSEDELDEAVGGVGGVEEQVPDNTGDGCGRGWWHDPNS